MGWPPARSGTILRLGEKRGPEYRPGYFFFLETTGLTTKYGAKTIFGVCMAPFFNAYLAYESQNLSHFQIVKIILSSVRNQHGN
jgi:hypothetical protein